MPTTKNFTSSYAGKAAAGYLLPALTGGDLFSTPGLTFHDNVKYKEVIKKFDSSNIIQSGATSGIDLYTPTGGLTISEVLLVPVPFKVNADLAFNDVYRLWESDAMKAGMNNEDIPAETQDAIITSFTERVSEFMDALGAIGNATGTTGNMKLVSGYATLLKAATGSTKIVGTTLSSSNILTEINKVVNGIPAAIKKDRSKLVLFCSPDAALFYEQNVAAQGYNTSVDGQSLKVYGIELRPIGGLSTRPNVMFLGERQNFHMATDIDSDQTEVALIDFRYTTGDEKVGFKMKWKVDVKVGFPQEAVLYGSNFI